jgi:hypothetical protein
MYVMCCKSQTSDRLTGDEERWKYTFREWENNNEGRSAYGKGRKEKRNALVNEFINAPSLVLGGATSAGVAKAVWCGS